MRAIGFDAFRKRVVYGMAVNSVGDADGIFVAHGANRGCDANITIEPSKTVAYWICYVVVFDNSGGSSRSVPTSSDMFEEAGVFGLK